MKDLKFPINAILYALIATGLTALILTLCETANDAHLTETTTAIYNGYILKENERHHPIIKINDKEYISEYHQSVRDSSYVGNTVTIQHDKNNIAQFKIIWDEKENK